MQLKINSPFDIAFEWIPYSQFSEIIEIGKGGFSTVYSAAKMYSINSLNILRIYGISQNPSTKNYIMILQYVKGGNFNDWINENYKNFDCDYTRISDMGLCGEVGNIDKTNIYGVMSYVAPEALRGKPYTQAAADIYSFGMIIPGISEPEAPYFVIRQHFVDYRKSEKYGSLH
ncbi:kinase-like domain-containing protein [Glomus cerebriforme]|uniref:Kinase-like domain-containing protein n=1 Tax=Glomus cerebriforme TaxID=658196 RepID=A0A397SNY1_9GLOM|nr:kinase-like domain-containing protein [Glomus cerebriforme]